MAYQPGWRATEVLGGLDETGKQWKTTRAKAYPEGLCRVLASQFAWYHEQIDEEGEEQESQELQDAIHFMTNLWDPYQQDSVGGTMTADYHPNVEGAAV